MPARRTERSSCPRNIRMICPTEEKHFVVHSSRKGRGCEFDEPIMVTALRDCDNSVMDACKDKWGKRHNNCSAPIFKQVVDYAFQGACVLHDLCYSSWFTKRKDCDVWFLHNMKQMCSIRRNWFTRFLCKAGAHTVYLAVRGFGGSGFDKGKDWAKENCTSETNPEGNPTKAPTSEGFGSGSGSGSESGEQVQQPDEQSTARIEVEEQSDENSPKPEQTDPTKPPKQDEQLDEPPY